jgi:predicted small lipoprotein YifL
VRLAAAALILLLAGCGNKVPVRIDGSSKERFEQTSSQARRDLPVADRIVFDRAIRTIGGRRHAERDPEALARVTFDGMTAEEIVADQKSRDR